MIKRTLLAAFMSGFSFIYSCAPSWSYPAQNGSLTPVTSAYVCVDLPEKELAPAHEAIAMWDRSLKQWKRFISIDVSGDQSYCNYWVHEAPHELPDDVKSESAAAWTSVGGREIWMRKGAYEGSTRGVLTHELGHALGAQHLPGTLMNTNLRLLSYDCPDGPTVAQVAAYNHVNIDLLSWCN